MSTSFVYFFCLEEFDNVVFVCISSSKGIISAEPSHACFKEAALLFMMAAD